MNKGIIKYKETDDYNFFCPALDRLARNMSEGYRIVSDQRLQDNNAVNAVYAYSNENLEALYNQIDIEDKKVLTVGSSGDQVLYAIGKGAKKVTLIDANPMALPFTELKLAVIKNCTFEEFQRLSSISSFFESGLHSKIWHDLSPQSEAFWGEIMLEIGKESSLRKNQTLREILDNMFQGGMHSAMLIDANVVHYSDKLAFDRIKKNLANCEIDFVEAPFEDFASSVDDKYDCILLSNISDYVPSIDFYDEVLALGERLTDQGIMQVHYDFQGINNDAEFIKRFALYVRDVDLKIASDSYNVNAIDNYRLDLDGFQVFKQKENPFVSPVSVFINKKYIDDSLYRLGEQKAQEIKELARPKELNEKTY